MNTLLICCRSFGLTATVVSLGLLAGCDTEKTKSPPPPPAGSTAPAALAKSRLKNAPISNPSHDSAHGGNAK